MNSNSGKVVRTEAEAKERRSWLQRGYLAPLAESAIATARKIGPLEIDMGGTSCKVPLATEYIEKMEAKGKLGGKRKAVRC